MVGGFLLAKSTEMKRMQVVLSERQGAHAVNASIVRPFHDAYLTIQKSLTIECEALFYYSLLSAVVVVRHH